jgi:hypothetical protein
MTDTFWMPGEPSGVDDKCVSLDVDKGAPLPAAMNDKPCDTLYNYICEVITLVHIFSSLYISLLYSFLHIK